MNLSICPIRYNLQNNYKTAVAQIAFKAESGGDPPRPQRIQISDNDSKVQNESDTSKTFAPAGILFSIIALVEGIALCVNSSNTQYGRAYKNMNDDILNKAQSGWVVDSVETHGDSVMNLYMHNKADNNKVQYNILDAQRYEVKKPDGQVIMHNFSNGQDYIKYEDKYVPVNGKLE